MNVKIRNRIILLAIFLLIVGCKENNAEKIEKQEVKKPLVFNVKFNAFKNIKLAFDEEKMLIDSTIWENNLQDSIVYFKINFENLKKQPIILKTRLIATRIPFLLRYSEGKDNKIVLEVVQQFNKIYSDSIIFRKDNIADFPVVEQAFRVGYQHNDIDEICQVQVKQTQDTIDISIQGKRNCTEKKR